MKKLITAMFFAAFLLMSTSAFASETISTPKGTSGAVKVHNDEGISHFNEGHWNVAIKHFKESLDSDPNFAVGHYNLAVAYHKAGNHVKSTKHFKKALKFGGNNSQIVNSKLLRGHIGN